MSFYSVVFPLRTPFAYMNEASLIPLCAVIFIAITVPGFLELPPSLLFFRCNKIIPDCRYQWY